MGADENVELEATVYAETIVHAAPQQFVSEAPYQIAIVELPDNTRRTVRIVQSTGGERAEIGTRVIFSEMRNGVPFYRVIGDGS